MSSLFNTKVSNTLTLIVNLKKINQKLWLPYAYISSINEKGQLTYLQQQTTIKTLPDFGLEVTAVRKQILQKIQQLSIKVLEKRFQPNARRFRKIDELIADGAIFKQIETYVDRELAVLLQLLYDHHTPICIEAQRKTWLEELKLTYPSHTLDPLLYFKKTPEGIHYEFQFKEQGKTWRIHDRDVYPLTNETAWIVVDYQLFKVADINGKMVKPFTKKNEVFIPNKHVKTYFQSYIMKRVAKLDVEADGFDIVLHNNLEKTNIQLHTHKEKGWVLTLKFHYTASDFGYSNASKQKMRMEIQENDNIVIHQTKRNFEQEKRFPKFLLDLGLETSAASYFIHPETTSDSNTNALLEWLITQQTQLEAFGFTIIAPEYNKKVIQLATPSVSFNVATENDWFDLKGVVRIGQQEVPFKIIAQYIRQNQALFELPDGTYAVIPQEWFERYQGIVTMGSFKSDAIRLEKSHYMLLEHIPTSDVSTELFQQSTESIDYQPSKQLKATLRPYQLEGVKWLVEHYHQALGACLADDMGLGKTIQTISLLLYAKEQKLNRASDTTDTVTSSSMGVQASLFDTFETTDLVALNALILLPASLIFNWQRELEKFAPTLTIYQHIGTKRYKDATLIQRFDVCLTTYQTALRDIELLKTIEFEYIILDESQQIKNKNSKIFRAVNELDTQHRLSLSGTPIENSLADLWSQMHFLNPTLLGSFNFFKKTFMQPIEKLQDEEQTQQLRTLIQPYLLRRTKDLVAKDLPPLTYQVFYSEMTDGQHKLYQKEKSKARNYLLENFNPNSFEYRNIVITTLTKLRQIANHPVLFDKKSTLKSGKFSDVLEYLDLIYKGNHKALIFSSFVSHLGLFEQQFQTNQRAYSLLTGKLSKNKRIAAIDQFEQNEAVKAFLISLKAGGTGLNLTAADYVFIIDPWWNPSAERQAIDRAHRIGQTKNVIAIKFITKGTIEEKILRLQERKSKLAADIIENSGSLKFTQHDLEYLLE